jgi:hypothetical protein
MKCQLCTGFLWVKDAYIHYNFNSISLSQLQYFPTYYSRIGKYKDYSFNNHKVPGN